MINTSTIKSTGFRRIISLIVTLVTAVTMLSLTVSSANAAAYPYVPTIAAQAHVQNDGWQGTRTSSALNGITIGTTGRSLRMECIQLGLYNAPASFGGIMVETHVANVGWTGYRKANCNGSLISGTVGQGNAIEAVRIQLYGPIANYYNVEYKLHLANTGWENTMHRNGAVAGTTGRGIRSEALFVRLTRK